MSCSTPVQILVVDDDPAIVELLEGLLQQGFQDNVQIKTATDPYEARRYLETDVVDLLITDLEMPGVNGLELLRGVKRRDAWTQVLLLTGHSSLDAVTTAMELGATDYLLKPLDPSELEEVVQGTLRRYHRWQLALADRVANR